MQAGIMAQFQQSHKSLELAEEVHANEINSPLLS